MSDALGNDIARHGYTEPARGLVGALQRHEQRAAERVVFPRQRDDDQTQPPPIPEPTGQHAVVVNQADHVFVRLEHRWYQAGGATVEPILWPDIHAVAVKSYGDPS